MTILKSRYIGVLVAIVALALTLIAWVDWSSNSDFSLKADHDAVSVTANSQAVMAVHISTKTSNAKPVKFSFSHVPAGVSVSATSDPLSPDIAVIGVETSSTAKPGNFQLTVTGTNGAAKHSFTVPVSVSVPVRTKPPFTMVVRPASHTVVSRWHTRFSVVTYPGRLPMPVTLTVSGLPSGASATFMSAGWVNGSAYMMNVSTTIDTAPGTYLFTVHGVEGAQSADAQGYLTVVNAVLKPFTIAGDGSKVLSPGITSPINLSISNTFKRDLTVAGLSVALVSTSNPSCATSNFVVTQYSGPSSLVVPHMSKRTLAQLGVPRSQWPSVKMINLLHTNQDTCKNVTLNLTYTGSGSGT